METNELMLHNEGTKSKSFTYSFDTPKSSEEVFNLILNVKKWWYGIYEETIHGKSSKVNDEFSFLAGGGVHFTKQRLVELVPNSKIVWKVYDSNLTFLEHPKEWVNTKIRFDISKQGDKSKVTFTHEGLVPIFECYESCSNAWTEYMEQLNRMLNN